MLRFIGWRIGSMVVTVLGMVTVVFFLLRMVPGDPAAYMLGDYATRDSVAALRGQLGLDKPLVQQYGIFLGRAVRGDLGSSTVTHEPALREVLAALPPSLTLAAAGVLLAVLIGVPAGVVSAVRRGSAWDVGSMLVTIGGMSFPVFWLGLVLILVFAEYLHVLPALGYSRSGGWDAVRALVLPAVVLALSVSAYIARLTRSAMLEVLGQDYIRVAEAMGVRRRRVVWSLALRNALVPIIAVVGVTVAFSIGNAILVEVVFSRPGIGSLVLKAIQARDYQLVQAGVLVLALIVVVVNTVLDLLYLVVDPRVRAA